MLFNQMKRFVAALLVCVLLVSLAPAMAQDYPCAGFAKDNVNMRRSASGSGTVITTVPAGDAVYVTGESGNYYIAEYNGKQGFILKTYVALAGEAEQNASSGKWAAAYKPLREGATGTQVKEMQSALIELGFLKGSADGKYGAKTGEAVAAFQKKNGLNESGFADAETLGMLFEGKVKNSKGRTKTVSVVPSVEGFPISEGKEGDLVKKLQTALKNLGYYTGKVDGDCGSGTVKAIKSFQKKNNLKQTGIADSEMQALLYSGKALHAKATATPKPTATPVPPVIGWENGETETGNKATFPFVTETIDSVNLRKGPSTSSSRLLTIPKGARITVEAIQGDFLKIQYQGSKKSYAGYVMMKYVDVPAIYLGGEALKSDADAQKKYTALSSGSSSRAVEALQSALKELGFYTAKSHSGTYDAATVTAVKAFQARNGILQTGYATAEIQKLIYEGKPLNSKGKKVNVSVLPPIAGVTMHQGDTGYQVEELQTALKDLGYYAGKITGEFDAATKQAVKKLQKAGKLAADGIAGKQTLALVEKYMTTPVPTIKVVTPTPAPITEDNVIVIHKGTRGLAVRRLQERLVELGYYSIEPDGIYDSNDITAVRAFQKKSGLGVDGVAGLETQQRLYAKDAMPAWATATPRPTSTPKPEKTPTPDMNTTLKIGSRGDDVTLLQARLTVLKYFSDTIDGRFGTLTAAAVAAFQQRHSLDADGIAGPKTLKKLYSSSAKEAAVTTQPTAKPAVSTTLEIGDCGSEVKKVQQMLIDLGYLTGAADGIFGTKTYLAVKNFQKANKLTADGIVGASTLSRLQALSEEDEGAQGATGNTALPVFKAPSAWEVRFANWFTETRALARSMPNAIVYDYQTGQYYNVNMFSFGKHCDAEPITASDTAMMRKIMGVENWTPPAVWVILSDGKVYMASTHSHGHTVDHNPNNDLTGHICIHFPREMSEAEQTGPYAVSHQKEILRGWEETQQMIGY